MSWVTIIWSMIASVSFTLATIYLLIWFRERRSWAYLCFFVLAVGVIGLATGEMGAMYAKSPAEYGTAVRWSHFAFGFAAVGSMGFVHFYFGTGKRWLFGVALGLRLLAVVMNFSTGLNLHIGAIQRLQQVSFLGEPVSMLGEWTPNPWVRLGQFAAVAQFVYVVDASLRLWRTNARESRRRAVLVGGTLAFFILFASAQAGLVAAGLLRMPIVVSFPFLAVLLAMGCELSVDVLRAARLAGELRESEQQLALATEAANLGVWIRDLVRNEVWATDKWRELLGFTKSERIDLNAFLQKLHSEDREPVSRTLAEAMESDSRYEMEYRVLLPEGRLRWIVSRGHVEFNRGGKPVLMRGVSLDITARKQAEAESLRQRAELAHVARVSTMGELAASVAHELNQPLGAILANAEAADLFLNQDPPALDELRAILTDIRKDDERASEVILRMRSLLRKHELERLPLEINFVVKDVLQVISGDAALRKVAINADLAPVLPKILGDRVHLQQVLINLILNGMDAMAGQPRERRRLSVRTRSVANNLVELAVIDLGHGIEPDKLPRVFEPFFSTKPNGMGMGLSISRTIIEAHHGKILAENNASGGATFRVTLPVAPGLAKP